MYLIIREEKVDIELITPVQEGDGNKSQQTAVGSITEVWDRCSLSHNIRYAYHKVLMYGCRRHFDHGHPIPEHLLTSLLARCGCRPERRLRNKRCKADRTPCDDTDINPDPSEVKNIRARRLYMGHWAGVKASHAVDLRPVRSNC